MKKAFFTLSLIISQISAISQDSMSIYQVTNELGYSESSKAIFKGKLLTSLNYAYSEWHLGNINQNFSNWGSGPNINIGYGITKRVDVRITTGQFSNTYRFLDGSTEKSGNIKNWSGLFFGTKVNLTNQKGWIPESAVSVDLSMPYQYESLELTTIKLNFAWSYLIGNNFRLGGDFLFTDDFDNFQQRNFFDSFHYRINARYELVNGFGVFVDVNLPKSFGGMIYNPNGGLYYRLNKNAQFHILYGTTMGNENKSYTYDSRYFRVGFSGMLLNK